MSTLKLLRRISCLTLEEVGQLVGRTKASVYGYETGQRGRRNTKTKRSISRAFCLPEQVIFDQEVQHEHERPA